MWGLLHHEGGTQWNAFLTIARYGGLPYGADIALDRVPLRSTEACQMVVDLPGKSGRSFAQFLKVISYWTGLMKVSAEWHRAGL